MMQHPFFYDKQILVVDQIQKSKNDRTWCFWEQQPGVFEEIVHHCWGQIDFYSNYYSGRFDLAPYQYKMIRSIDLYEHVLGKAKQKPNVHFHYGNVQSIKSNAEQSTVTVNNEVFTGNYIFNSIIFNQRSKVPQSEGEKHFYHLLQHFKGWLIETPENVFDKRIATFMDFRVSQKHGTTFIYVLPVAANRALVEYTLFTEELLQQHEYDVALKQYIKEYLRLNNYRVAEEEFGVIPMTNKPFPKNEERIINIGTAGGQTKPSSGFTFQFIQKQSDAIIKSLMNNEELHDIFSTDRRFRFYDSTLLNILYHKKSGGDKIFADLFSKNPPQRILRFLDNETNYSEELKIMRSVPLRVFLPAAIQELLK